MSPLIPILALGAVLLAKLRGHTDEAADVPSADAADPGTGVNAPAPADDASAGSGAAGGSAGPALAPLNAAATTPPKPKPPLNAAAKPAASKDQAEAEAALLAAQLAAQQELAQKAPAPKPSAAPKPKPAARPAQRAPQPAPRPAPKPATRQGANVDVTGPRVVPSSSSSSSSPRPPAGCDMAKAREAAPALARLIASKKYNYPHKTLAAWQTLAGIASDGIYGRGTATALKYFTSLAPKPLFAQGVAVYNHPWGN